MYSLLEAILIICVFLIEGIYRVLTLFFTIFLRNRIVIIIIFKSRRDIHRTRGSSKKISISQSLEKISLSYHHLQNLDMLIPIFQENLNPLFKQSDYYQILSLIFSIRNDKSNSHIFYYLWRAYACIGNILLYKIIHLTRGRGALKNNILQAIHTDIQITPSSNICDEYIM